MLAPLTLALDPALAALNAAGEETRLRLLALLAEAELTVSEVVAILGQSQPRVSRHLKLLVEAGVVERHREGAWAFFRLAPSAPRLELARSVIVRSTPADPVLAGDRARLAEVRQARADSAARYFAAHAAEWDDIRALPYSRGTGRGRHSRGARRRADPRGCSILAPAPDACWNFSRRAPNTPSASTSPRRCWRRRAGDSRKAARATCNCARATFTRCRSSATPAMSRSCIRCCIISTIPAAPCARRRGRSRRADD